MPFRVAARTVFHLGAELISSDAIAFYELIKNAFDARSKRVHINVTVCIPHEQYLDIKDELDKNLKVNLKGEKLKEVLYGLRKLFTASIDPGAPEARELRNRIENASSLEELRELLESANFIEIIDTGEGMSLDDLDDIYLTIGTRSRHNQRKEIQRQFDRSRKKETEDIRPILGEKGVGRLSTMRLGDRLKVITSRVGEGNWNILEIDWSRFSHESDELISEIEIAPNRGEIKGEPSASGTTIFISALTSEWTKGKLEEIAKNEFSKLSDPFVPGSRYKIDLKFNSTPIPIPPIDEIIFSHAHAVVEASFEINEIEGRRVPSLVGRIDYLMRHRETTFRVEKAELISRTNVESLRPLISLGPFKVKFYWFNRGLITASQGIPDWKLIRILVANWAGGLMVYRDRFRVNPYGGTNDDWLDLDKKAFSSGGYKLNRQQIVGKVEISSLLNPALVDQTNREGLRDSEEKNALKALLQHLLTAEFKSFIQAVDKEVEASEPLLNFADLEDRVAAQEKQAQVSLKLLVQKYPQVKEDTNIYKTITESVETIRSLMMQARSLAESYERGRSELVNLAGLGLMLEIVGHELNRVTLHVLDTLNEGSLRNLSDETESIFRTLKLQLITLQKRLRILDPLSTAGRQRKKSFDVVETISGVLKSHEAQFERHNIKLEFEISPEGKSTFKINAVEGMVIQILENLLSNSVYWLKQQKKLENDFQPQIKVVVNSETKEIIVTDNGPGISPDRREHVFQPFVTSKPAGEGKGLGLYISREIAKYNNSRLYLSNAHNIHKDKLNTFILALEDEEK